MRTEGSTMGTATHNASLWRRLMILGLSAAVGLVAACSDDDGKGDNFVISDDLAIRVEPNPIVFGAVAVGNQEVRDVIISHNGTSGTLELRSLELVTSSADLSMTQPTVLRLAPGETTSFTVTYVPSDELADSGVVRIATNIPVAGGTQTLEVPVTTPQSSGMLFAQPSTVDFGKVQTGTTANKTVSIRNVGFSEVTVSDLAIGKGGSEDFGIVTTPELPLKVQPDGAFEVELSYTPTLGDIDSNQLIVTYADKQNDGEHKVLLRGEEVAPRLVIFPNPVDFGKRATNETHEITVNLANQGDLPLVITKIERVDMGEWSDTVTVEDVPAGGLTLADATPAGIKVSFTPPGDMPVLTSPVAGLRIISNDPAGAGETLVPVFGRPDAPSLQVNPPELVDFGFVAQNLTTKRIVSLYNGGSADLVVDALTVLDDTGALAGEYTLAVDATWGPTASPATSGVIPPGESRKVGVLFTNNGGDTGTAWGKLIIDSQDGDNPSWEVTLKAQRAGAPTCEVQLVPDLVDYGIVPRGFTKTMKFQLVNVGSGECGFHSAFVNDCASGIPFPIPGFPISANCADPSNTPQIDGNSTVYTVTQKPFSAANNLKPGMSYPVAVTFTPPQSAPIFGDETTAYPGLLGVRITDPYNPGGGNVIYPMAQSAGTWLPNLHAKSGMAELSVFPQELDFGVVTIGCHSQTFTVTAYNVGTAPLDITDWELVGCTPEFKVKDYPALDEPVGDGTFKKTLNPEAGVEFKVAYAPQDESQKSPENPDEYVKESCGLALYTNGSDTPAAVVPLLGAGTYETEHTDEFIQKSGQDVDVLFVVDNSGSMSEEQNNLSKNFGNFVNQATTWNNDYQIGVISTDIDKDGGMLLGTPRFVTKATVGQFGNNVKLGTNGSGTEQGLAAAQMALSLPLTADSTTACTSAAQCNQGEACVDGFCGGPNRAFMRKDAALEVVFVSDEDDYSPADINFYINFFKNIKGFYNSNLMHAHAIVGPSGGCSSSNGDAIAGHRYIEVAKATGGNIISICESDFSTGLKSIGEIAFGLKVQFFLTRTAQPATLEVKVADVPCPAVSGGQTNWHYDQPSNSVVFNETGACMPQPGDKVWIHYETLCFLE